MDTATIATDKMKDSIASDAAKRNHPQAFKLLDHSTKVLLLDLDGTILDLYFDNHFWQQHLCQTFAAHNHIPLLKAQQHIGSLIATTAGTLPFYDVDYWSAVLKLDIIALKIQQQHLLSLHAGALLFLQTAQAAKMPCYLISNAHPRTLAFKLARVPLADFFVKTISAFAYHACKEQRAFWQRFLADCALNPADCAFFDDNLAAITQAQQARIGQVFAIDRPDSRAPANQRRIKGARHIDFLADLIR